MSELKEIALKNSIKKWWIKNIFSIIILAFILFVSSGNINWIMAWLYLFVIIIIIFANSIFMDPSLAAERSKLQEGTKKWDIALSTTVDIWGPLATLLTAGLDNRFGLSGFISLEYKVIALAVIVLIGLLGTWAMATNKFFSATVRIQTDRGHKVVSQGPYRYVRHPGYISAIISILVTPIALGSVFALIPGMIVAGGYTIRTALEDRTLQEELEGYREYAERVKYRLIPGIW